MTNSEIFRRAADYIREHGWRQGALGDSGGPRCAQGAIRAACGMDVKLGTSAWTQEALGASYLASQRVVAMMGAKPVMIDAIVAWNDMHGRTAAEVIEAFETWAFDEDLKAAAQSPIKACVVTLHIPEPYLGFAPAESQLVEA